MMVDNPALAELLLEAGADTAARDTEVSNSTAQLLSSAGYYVCNPCPTSWSKCMPRKGSFSAFVLS